MLSYALLLLASTAPAKILQDGIKYIAILMDDAEVEKSGDRLSSYVINKLSPLLDRAQDITTNASNAVDSTRKSADRLHNTYEETRDEIQRSVDSLNSSIDNTEPKSLPSRPGGPISYAAAASKQLPLSHPTNLARARIQERQIVIDKDPSAPSDNLEDLTERELVAKANETIEMMRGQLGEEGNDASMIGAKRLKNGGILYELNSSGAAQWIRQERECFEKHFGGTSIIKDRVVAVLVENVPVDYAPEALAESSKIERDSDIDLDSLISTRWIKPVQRRTDSQRTAHLIAKFSTREAANKVIRDGIVIAGKRCRARKMKKEPRRCLKCHDLKSGHFAASCDKPDTCGTCGQNHRTSECLETDATKFRCANCNVSGHASWDRQCPKYAEASRRIELTDLEHSYKFFPGEEPWTWEQIGAPTPNGTANNHRDQEREQTQTRERRQAKQSEFDWSEEVEQDRPWLTVKSTTKLPPPFPGKPKTGPALSQPSGSQGPTGMARQRRQSTLDEFIHDKTYRDYDAPPS